MAPPKWSHEVICMKYEFKTAEVQQDCVTFSANCSRGMGLIKLNITMTTRYSVMQPSLPQNVAIRASLYKVSSKPARCNESGSQREQALGANKSSKSKEHQDNYDLSVCLSVYLSNLI